MSKIRILKNCEKGQNTQIVLFLMTVFFLLMFLFPSSLKVWLLLLFPNLPKKKKKDTYSLSVLDIPN